jgi:hypothetical protein
MANLLETYLLSQLQEELHKTIQEISLVQSYYIIYFFAFSNS